MRNVDERLLADFASLEPVYVDGVLGLVNLGGNFAAVYYRLIPVKADDGSITMEKIPVMAVVRPVASLEGCRDCKVRSMAAIPPPEQTISIPERLN